VLAPVGTAPGLVVPPADGTDGPTVVVLPGPPAELRPMWDDAVATDAFAAATTAATVYRQGVMRLFGIPESEIAATLRALEADGLDLSPLEITTCLRRGEIEIATRYEPPQEEVYERFAAGVRARHSDTLFSEDGSTIDEQVAHLLEGHTVATAESCTAGLLAARLTDRPGSSAYVLGGLVVYDNRAKVELAGVDERVIEEYGAVSTEVAEALADGARTRLHADIGVGITGIAGPDGGTPEKPVGLVCFSVAGPGEARITRSTQLPGNRAAIRDRAVTVALHLLRRALLGSDPQERSAVDRYLGSTEAAPPAR
jgi:nicotinamide-nucleotide amidase